MLDSFPLLPRPPTLLSSHNVPSGRWVRGMFHYYATGVTPAMVAAKSGSGSAYVIAARDSQGRYFDGSKTCKIGCRRRSPPLASNRSQSLSFNPPIPPF